MYICTNPIRVNFNIVHICMYVNKYIHNLNFDPGLDPLALGRGRPATSPGLLSPSHVRVVYNNMMIFQNDATAYSA